MNKEEIYSQLTSVFQDIFDNESLKLDEHTVLSELQDWDSLEFINIVVAVMETFKIKFNIEDLKNIKNVGQLVDIIDKRIV